ncbi:MAG TPA: type I-C CRISPR-associated protein Cas8c/Csd1, partial [Calditrichaeota bacterium]|nr:type I-C CRISPR-associated protein Cas8c/Csd1 [Calditrichota bacterium]
MILQKLTEFYENKAEQKKIAPYGWERKAIPFLIRLNEDGSFSDLFDTRDNASDKGRVYTIPKTIERPGTNAWQTTFLLWDHIGYALGLVTENEKEETVKKQHNSFKKKLKDLPDEIKQDKGVQAVIRFLENGDFSGITQSEYWEELYKKKPNITFQLSSDPESIIAQNSAIREYVDNATESSEQNGEKGKCLVTGKVTTIARTHPKIKGVYGAQPSGAAIVSFNDSAYTSYNKKRNFNAPVGNYA